MKDQGDGHYLNCYVDGLNFGLRRKRVTKVIFGREARALAKRRQSTAKKLAASGGRCEAKPQIADRTNAPITGIALSGGGIRSASVCLGALQAVDACSGIEGIDYLSTVSGGGYIGCSLTAGLHKCEGVFPFLTTDFHDSDSVRHIRDFSRYLIPRGMPDVITAVAIFLRGILANVILLLPFLFLAVWMTLVSHPTVDSLGKPSFLGVDLSAYFGNGKSLFGVQGFWVTTALLVVDGVALVLWAYGKSLTTSSMWRRVASKTSARRVAADEVNGDNSSELNGLVPTAMRFLLALTAISAFFELQPFILRQMQETPAEQALAQASDWKEGALALLRQGLDWAPMLAPLAGVAAFFSKYLGEIQNIAERSASWTALAKRLGAKSIWLFVGLIIPGLVWFVYLKLSYSSLVGTQGDGSILLQGLREASASLPLSRMRDWLLSHLGAPGQIERGVSSRSTTETELFVVAFFVSGLMALLINPNATTFFRLYRDRLNKAFVFDPNPRHRDKRGDLHAISLKLHRIDITHCPYPIINAALNLEGSQFANKRGRNADFFVFTPEYVGSPATGYVGSKRLFMEEPDLDVGTAMAISGAAFSPNMGRATVKALTPTLALLNARLGYWMLSPREVTKRKSRPFLGDIVDGCQRSFFLLLEMFGWIDEKSSNVYLTDGGNLENLGLYELLRRQCDVIIAIDAEADPTLDFPSLISLTRFALTDLGTRIDLPWEEIRRSSMSINEAFKSAESDAQFVVPKRNGPHCAVCDVEYGPDRTGLLFYFKTSLSGDENDLVFDYKRRNPDFPHETTMDQFFGEEQLEAYRSLGFHMVAGVLRGETPFIIRPRPNETDDAAKARALNALRTALGI